MDLTKLHIFLGLYFLRNDDNTVQDLSCCFICSVLTCETLCLIALLYRMYNVIGHIQYLHDSSVF